MRYHHTSSRSAFTFVELLVVIAIVAMLFSLLVPAVGRASDAARLALCKSNLRMITVAHSSYSVDERNWYPHNPRKENGTIVVRYHNGADRWFLPTGTNPLASPMLAPYFTRNPSMDPRVNEILACPQGVVDYRRPNNSPYYSFYANRINAQGNNQFPWWETDPNTGAWKATWQYADNEKLLLQKPNDTMYFQGYKNNFGWSTVDGEYNIVASDLTIRDGVGGSRVITNHSDGDGYVQGTTSVVWTTGNATTNYSFTDGSVRPYSYPVGDFRSVMNMGLKTEGGAQPILFPKAWAKQ